MNSFYMKHLKLISLYLILLIILLIWLSVVISKKAISPILYLKDGVKEIAKGNLDKKLDIKTGDEIEALSDSINDMSSDLKKYIENLSMITAEKERIATELNVARNIQTGLLPSVEPYFSNKKEFDLAVSMNPAKEVGGDFYDFYMLDENHLAVTIADVSGKGVGAALFMMISKTVLKNCAMLASSAYSEGQEPDLAFVMEQANQQLTENNKEFMFVTVFFGILDLKTGLFSYVNAGHNPPLVHHNNEDEFSFILNEKKNRVMGVRKNTKYQVYTLNLYSGDKLFFYTDGITEAMNKQKELFGEQRLKAALDSLKDCENAKEILSVVYNAVKQHACDAEQSDDMTMLGLVYK
jgi:sigma-B regulation protein RsbU (phosphoserine phosphatase)